VKGPFRAAQREEEVRARGRACRPAAEGAPVAPAALELEEAVQDDVGAFVTNC